MGASAQTPALQAPSEQRLPSARAGLEHWPLAGAQVPATWHSSCAAHATGAPTQVPSWHESPDVHWFESGRR
jgi:hypothetical protein